MVVRNPNLVQLEVNPMAIPVLHRFTVAECLKMVEVGILNGEHRCELLNGLLIEKPMINPPHASTGRRLRKILGELLGENWVVCVEDPIELLASEGLPCPDLSIVDPPISAYDRRHPCASDVALLIEISDSSLLNDQTVKLESYARDKIPVYWIVNLIDRRVEVYTQPRGGKKPTYRKREDYPPGTSVPVILRGVEIGSIEVDAILPKEV